MFDTAADERPTTRDKLMKDKQGQAAAEFADLLGASERRRND